MESDSNRPMHVNMLYVDVLTSADVLPLLFDPLKFDVLIRQHMQVRHSRFSLEFQYAKEINGPTCFLASNTSLTATITDIPVRCFTLR